MNQRLIDKFTSGRWILTIIGGVAFLYCVITKQIEAATITAILMAIFTSYFNRHDRSNGTDRTDNKQG